MWAAISIHGSRQAAHAEWARSAELRLPTAEVESWYAVLRPYKHRGDTDWL